jgi:hydroxypyruvate reductase
VEPGPRRILQSLYRAALAGVDPERSTSAGLTGTDVVRTLSGARRVGVFACGKAAAGMARAASAILGPVPMLAVLPRGTGGGGLPGSSVRWASHPDPDASSVAAAREALRFFRGFGPGDAIVCLISGGTSSLIALPRRGVTLAHQRKAVRELAASGAAISEINRLRTSLSAVKGGRLGRATKASLVSLVMSDVPRDDPAVVGSGPTIRNRRSDVVRVVASNRDGLESAAAAALEAGLAPRIERRRFSGDAREAGERLGRRALELPPGGALLAGGEAVVRLGSGRGRGGRCLELALGAARPLRGANGVMLLAASSDGLDGTSGAAGAFVGGRTLSRAAFHRMDPQDALRRHDTRPLFLALGDLFTTGPTGTNVADWVFAVRRAGAIH